jgi:hypothetical protein
MQSSSVPTGTTVRIVRPIALLEFEDGDLIQGGPLTMSPAQVLNGPRLVFQDVRIGLPIGLTMCGTVQLKGATEVYSATSYNALILNCAGFYFGVDVGANEWTGVQFVGADDIDRPYLYVMFSPGHLSAVLGYLNVFSTNNVQMYSGRMTQGFDMTDSVVYPGNPAATFSNASTQATWITGAGFGLINQYGGYQSWQEGDLVQIDTAEDILISNWGNLKNKSTCVFNTAGVLRVNVGAQALLSSWAGAPPGGNTFAAGLTSSSTASSISAGSKVGPNTTDPMAVIIRPN